jgi:hypothetical protein
MLGAARTIQIYSDGVTNTPGTKPLNDFFTCKYVVSGQKLAIEYEYVFPVLEEGDTTTVIPTPTISELIVQMLPLDREYGNPQAQYQGGQGAN